MNGDIDVAAAGALEDPSVEPATPAQALTMNIIKGTVVAVPLSIAWFLGIIALALRNDDPDWTAWLLMAVGIGILSGVFFGMLFGFVRSGHLFDD